MPSENVLPMLGYYFGGRIAGTLAVFLLLVGLFLYVKKNSPGRVGCIALSMAAGLFAVTAWMWLQVAALSEDNRLKQIRPFAVRLVGQEILSRTRLADIESLYQAAPPEEKASLTNFASQYDRYRNSVAALEQLVWQLHLAGPWNEEKLLLYIQSPVKELVKLHHGLGSKLKNLECNAPRPQAGKGRSERLQSQLVSQLQVIGAIGEQFDGNDFPDRAHRFSLPDYQTLLVAAAAGIALSIIGIVTALYVASRRRTFTGGEFFVTILGTGLCLVSLWLAYRALWSEPVKLLDSIYPETVSLHRQNRSLDKLTREITFARDVDEAGNAYDFDRFQRDYSDYLRLLASLDQIVKAWQRLLGLGEIDGQTAAATQSGSKDEMLTKLHSTLVQLFQKFVYLQARTQGIECVTPSDERKSRHPLREFGGDWLNPFGGTSLEQQLMDLPR